MHHQNHEDQSATPCMRCVIERDQRTTKQRIKEDDSAWRDGGLEPAILTTFAHRSSTSASSGATASTPNDKSNCDTCDKLLVYQPAANRCRQFNLISLISQRAYLSLVVIVFLCIASHHTAMSAAIRTKHFCVGSPIITNNAFIKSKTLEELLRGIITGTSNALYNATKTTQIYASEMFDLDLNPMHRTWRNHSEPWLFPNNEPLPKLFKENLPENVVTKLKYDGTAVRNVSELLMDSFERFQRISIAIESITKNHNDQLGIVASMLNGLQVYIKSVLCEIQTTLMEHNMKKHRDPVFVDDEFVPESTNKYVSTWIVLREYINLLEYNKESIDILKKRIADENETDTELAIE